MANIYQIEHNGQVYTVEADSDEEALAAVEGADSGPAPQSMDKFNADPLGEMFKANAEQNQAQSLALATGVPEGLRRVAGGVKQFAGGLQDMYKAFVKGQPYYDPFKRKYEASSSFNQATITEKSRQELSRLEAQEAGVNPGLRDAVAATTEQAALGAAAEAGIASRATTLTGNIIRQGASGAAQSAVQFDADHNGSDVIVGAAAPAAFGAFAGATNAIRNSAARTLNRLTKGSRTEAAIENAQKVLPNFEASLAQRTGIPEMQTLEQAAYNDRMVKFYADQNDKLVGDISTILQQPLKPGQDLNTDFVMAKATAQGKLDQMVQNRISLWENGMNDVRTLVPAKGPKNVPAQNVVAQFEKERDDMANVLRQMGTSKVNVRARRALEDLLTPQGPLANLQNPKQKGIGVDQFSDLLQGMTKLQRESTDPSVRAFATRMRRALDKDVLNLQSYQGPALPAVEKLLQVRTEYQRASELERLMKDSVTYKLLGVGQKRGSALPTSDELVGNFSQFSPERQREFRSWAEKNSPDILNTMRNKTINEALMKSKTITEARDSQVSLEQLADALFDPKRGYDIRTSGLWSPSDQQKFDGIKDGLRVIANARSQGRGAGTSLKAEDVTINLASRSIPFVTRQLTRILFGSKAAQFMTDPRALEYLTTIRKTSGATQLAARMGLMELLQNEYEASPAANSDQPNQPQP